MGGIVYALRDLNLFIIVFVGSLIFCASLVLFRVFDSQEVKWISSIFVGVRIMGKIPVKLRDFCFIAVEWVLKK
jgi:hypothetical protein